MTSSEKDASKRSNSKETLRAIWRKELIENVKRDSKQNCRDLNETTTRQVQLDVKRSFSNITNKDLKQKYQRILQQLILNVLRRNVHFSYYQGYHDVASIFILLFTDIEKTESDSTLAVELELVSEMLYHFSLLYLRDFLMSTLDFTMDQLRVVPKIFAKLDTEIYETLFGNSDPKLVVSAPVSCLLTFFSHDLNNTEQIFDIFNTVVENKTMSWVIYIYCLIIVQNKKTLMKSVEATRDSFLNENDFVNINLQTTFYSGIDDTDWPDIFSQLNKQPKTTGDLPDSINQLSTLNNSKLGLFERSKVKLSLLEKIMKNEFKLNEKLHCTSSKNLASFSVSSTIKFSIAVGVSALIIGYISSAD